MTDGERPPHLDLIAWAAGEDFEAEVKRVGQPAADLASFRRVSDRSIEWQRERERRSEQVKLTKICELLLSAVRLYGGYRVTSRGPYGCILDAIELARPDIAAEIKQPGRDWKVIDEVYDKHFGDEPSDPLTSDEKLEACAPHELQRSRIDQLLCCFSPRYVIEDAELKEALKEILYLRDERERLHPAHWESNGEAGDGQLICDACGRETDEDKHPATECVAHALAMESFADSFGGVGGVGGGGGGGVATPPAQMCGVGGGGGGGEGVYMATRCVSVLTLRKYAEALDPDTHDLSLHASLSAFEAGCREDLRESAEKMLREMKKQREPEKQ